MITEDEVMRLFERADPARADDAAPVVDAAGYLDALRTRSNNVTIIETESTSARPPSRHRGLIITAAAAAVVLIVAGAIVLAIRDDSNEPEVPSAPPPTAADTAAAEAEQVARGFFEAENAYDADRALTYLSDDYIAAELGTPEQYRLDMSFGQAVSNKTFNIDCEQQSESAAGMVIRCTYDYHSFRSDELGLGPFTGDYKDLTIRDGKVVAVEAHYEGLTNGFSDQMWEPFANWVAAEHPDDVLKMYEDASQTGWRITEESVPLWEQRTLEYAAGEGPVSFGLPPAGAMPSTPETGELVLHVWGPFRRAWVYADGRLIWYQLGGGGPPRTDYLEQRLTPEGVELLQSEAISTGLFDQDRALGVDHSVPCVTFIEVRNGDRLVRVSYTDDRNTSCRLSLQPATQEQADALMRLEELFADPAAWLPASAWENQGIRAYVPSRFEVCYGGILPADLTVLPGPAQEMLSRAAPGRYGNTDDYCTDLTTEEARALAEALDGAGLEQAGPSTPHQLSYQLANEPEDGRIWFTPHLPHGDAPCFDCG